MSPLPIRHGQIVQLTSQQADKSDNVPQISQFEALTNSTSPPPLATNSPTRIQEVVGPAPADPP